MAERQIPAHVIWYRTAVRNLRKRWLQLAIVLVAFALTVGASPAAFGPTAPDPKKSAEAQGYKYLICDRCGMEVTYNKEQDSRPCPKCQAPNTGFFRPSKSSVKEGGLPNPWRWYNVALGFEVVAAMGAVVYLLTRPVRDPTTIFYLLRCPNCGQRMRYREVSLGGVGSCPKCKRMVQFPDEHDAVREDVHLKREAAAMAADDANDD